MRTIDDFFEFMWRFAFCGFLFILCIITCESCSEKPKVTARSICAQVCEKDKPEITKDGVCRCIMTRDPVIHE